VSVKTRTTGFYRDDAARIAAQAARIAPPDEPVLRPRPAESRTPQILLDEPSRPPLAPEPAINENRATPRRSSQPPMPERRPVGRIIAWVVIAPFYAAGILGSAALLVLAGKFFLKL
jgi:hypothetical protein